MGLTIGLLGHPGVTRDGEVAEPRGRKTWALLVYLLLTELPPSRQRVAGLLFSEAEDPLAAVRWTLADVRRMLGEQATVGGDPLKLELPTDTAVDVIVLVEGRWSEASQLPGLGRDLLEGLSFPSAPGFELWLDSERRRLRGAAAAVLHEAGLASLAYGDAERAVEHARRLVDLDPLDENHHVLLVRALSAAGAGAAADAAAAAAAALLRDVLGVEPTSALHRAAHPAPAATTFVATPAAVTARLEAGEAAIDAGSWEGGLDLLRQAVTTARSISDLHLRARAHVALGSALVHAARGFDEEGSAALHEGVVLAQRSGDLLLAATAQRELGYVEFLRARYGRAQRWLTQAAESAAGDPTEFAWIRLIEGACHSDLAEHAAAAAALREAVAIADEHDDPRAGAFARSFLGRWHLLRDDLAAAAEHLERSIEQARGVGWTALVPWPQALMAETQLLRGDLEAADATFDHACAMGVELGDVCWQSIGLRGLGLVAAGRGDIDRAVTLLEQATHRCLQMPDTYLWIATYGLDALCSVGVDAGLTSTVRWIEQLERAANTTGQRELTLRALVHRARLGDHGARVAVAALAPQIDNPALQRRCEALVG